jgi:hypothetical protein
MINKGMQLIDNEEQGLMCLQLDCYPRGTTSKSPLRMISIVPTPKKGTL